jgi:putative nucleotidyltransferase with HDIG domain
MEQLYHRRLSPVISTMLKNNWQHSLYVAALSHFIATNYTQLNADEALLSGLIHDIGALPILEYSEMLLDVAIDEKTLKKIVHTLHPKVGMLVLKTWNFSPALITVVAEHEKLDRDPGTEVDYTDVVIVANLLSYIGTDHPYNKLDWTSVPAFSRLALTPEESVAAIKSAHEEIAETQRLFTV